MAKAESVVVSSSLRTRNSLIAVQFSGWALMLGSVKRHVLKMSYALLDLDTLTMYTGQVFSARIEYVLSVRFFSVHSQIRNYSPQVQERPHGTIPYFSFPFVRW